MSTVTRPAPADSPAGILYGLGAYGIWGLVVIYFKQLTHVDPVAIIAHRLLWCVAFLAPLLLLATSRRRMASLFRDRGTLSLLPLSAALLATNWVLFVYCNNTGRVMQSALAYYLTPLMMAGLGRVLLGERLRGAQAAAMVMAGLGVAGMVWAARELQWMPIVIAGTWSLYSLLRRVRQFPAAEGLLVEVTLLSPLAFAWLAWFGPLPAESPNAPVHDWLLLAASGVVSTVPLVLFGLSAARVRLTTLGFLQYLAPTIQLALGVLMYGEEFGWRRGVAFALIWGGLLIYTFDALRRGREARRQRVAAVAAQVPD